ncbi:helicase-related protein [Gleimia sp. 6138-11-ORH1]|uniref:ATP-dependent RNA helicase n=1 Tax=Gleimia sp. 6138-11-ORH1 TaxID=2973937 RepID=UPI002166DCEC|nr:ATP-dependent helicase C-terminal domain-containing protein [Gleimia sp. 6138-11-ORH1]MCS4484862.1 helicase-related protein [Gleimia sp. 6138-11-ORH1]
MKQTPFDPILARCELPIMAVAGGLKRALSSNRQLVLSASPGAGKTTIVPLLVAQSLLARAQTDAEKTPSGLLPKGRVIVAQPRRVAVRSAARYVASLLGEPVGKTVGWRMRADTKVSAETRIEFTTTGTLLRRLLAEPDLPGVDALIFDEVHERHLDADLALAFALDVAAIREDLTLIAMSATADTQRFAGLISETLGVQTPVLEVEHPLFPLETRWVPPRNQALDVNGLSNEFLTHLASVTQTAFTEHGSTLVFVDTIANTERLCQLLTARNIPAFALHSQVTAQKQDEILASSETARVIVATEIAETSLTVPGVNCVVDSGVSRTPRFDTNRQTTHLVTVSASQSALIQRAGRANRTGKGIVYRAFSQTEFARAKAYAPPEILGADLTEATLLAYAWSAPEQLALLDAFPGAARKRAEENLLHIGALEPELKISDSGRILAQIPTDPRLAHGLLTAFAWGIKAQTAARVVAEIDVHLEKRLVKLIKHYGEAYARIIPPSEIPVREADAAAIVWGAAYPLRIARLTNENTKLAVARFTSVAGTGLEVEAGTQLAGSKWIVAGETQGINGVIKVRAGTAISEGLVLSLAQFSLNETTEIRLENRRLLAWKTRRLGALELNRSKVPATAAQVYEALEKELSRGGAQEWQRLFPTPAEVVRFVNANNYLAGKDSAFNVIDSQLLAANLELFLGNSLAQICAGASLDTVDVLTGLKLIVGWQTANLIDTLIPAQVKVPSGRQVPVEIDPERGPTISVKLQECFGWQNVPAVLGRQISLELLSPAGRPLAVTGDLTHFFNEVYASVRAEMRGRYPKHPWPENPWEAVATAKTKRALGNS